MADNIIHIKSISEIHAVLELPKPEHPLISLIDAGQIQVREEALHAKIIYDFYSVSFKDHSHGIKYGRNTFDFQEGMMVFAAPGQVYTPIETVKRGDMNGWILYFHPDLIRNTPLGENIGQYSFFNYDIFEALHLSDQEQTTIQAAISNIEQEYKQRIDNHSQRILVSNLELLLNYCLRFYERQFNTRTHQNKDVTVLFEKALKEYFGIKQYLDEGIPSTGYFANKVHLSQHYFGDLVKKETGRTPKDHINDQVVEKAKDLLLSTRYSVSEIAYELGFNYPHYFTRLFKAKTGVSPTDYRSVN